MPGEVEVLLKDVSFICDHSIKGVVSGLGQKICEPDNVLETVNCDVLLPRVRRRTMHKHNGLRVSDVTGTFVAVIFDVNGW